eukprot:gene5512-5748_t
MRSPYDTPLRDGNRDRLIGLLTERAAKTLMVYLMETNVNVYGWLVAFYKSNPIPKHGSWDEVSGEAFLRKLLSMPIEEAKYNTGRESLFDNVASCGVDPRSIAQRIMDIRSQLSEEFIQELQAIAEENALLLSDADTASSNFAEKAAAVRALNAALRAALPEEYRASHPELLDSLDQQQPGGFDSPSDSSSSSSDGRMDMQDIFAQLKQSMQADVAALYSQDDASDPSLPLLPPAAAVDGLQEMMPEERMAAAAGGSDDESLLGLQQPADGDHPGPHISAASACLAAALPKGWGPRLGPGFSSIIPRRNNIVSSAKLVSAITAAALSSVDGGPHNDAGSSSNSCGGSVTNSI